jgi:hypothetical protein
VGVPEGLVPIMVLRNIGPNDLIVVLERRTILRGPVAPAEADSDFRDSSMPLSCREIAGAEPELPRKRISTISHPVRSIRIRPPLKIPAGRPSGSPRAGLCFVLEQACLQANSKH